MKKMRLYFLLLLIASILYGCRVAPVSMEPAPDVGPRAEFHDIDPEQVPHASIFAMAILDLAHEGVLESIPYVKVNPQGKNLENKTDYGSFRRHSMVITEFEEAPDGTVSQTTVVESLDNLGRMDLSRNRIVYRLRDADEEEIAEMRESFIQTARAVRKMDKEFRGDFKLAVVEYQKGVGLTPDGILGKKTATSLVQGMSTLEIQELSTHMLYPENPRHAFYVLDFETTEREAGKFYQGFGSLEEVRKHALTTDQFRNLAQPEKRFVLFAYFFDRVNPNWAINLGLSGRAKRKTKLMSPAYYAVPGEWPVLTETIRIDRKLGSSRLYVNLFINKEYVSSLRLH